MKTRNSQIQEVQQTPSRTQKYTKVHHNQILKIHQKGKNIIISQKKKRNITYTY